MIGGQVPQVYRLSQISSDEWLDKKRLFDEKADSDWSRPALMSVRAKAKREHFFEILLGRSEICSEHVDLLQSRGLQW